MTAQRHVRAIAKLVAEQIEGEPRRLARRLADPGLAVALGTRTLVEDARTLHLATLDADDGLAPCASRGRRSSRRPSTCSNGRAFAAPAATPGCRAAGASARAAIWRPRAEPIARGPPERRPPRLPS